MPDPSLRSPVSGGEQESSGLLDGGIRLVAILAGLCAILVVAAVLRGTPGRAGASPSAAPASAEPVIGSYLLGDTRAAAPISLSDPDDRPFTLAGLRGSPVLVFFGYTHCPDVCPATIGTIGEVIRGYAPGVRAVFVSIDPERDTPAWLKEYSQYLPAGLTPVTGTAAQVRITADAWGIRYARVDTGTQGAYSMSHTADVFLVDAAGYLRARFPFGTGDQAIEATLRHVAATPVPLMQASSAAASDLARWSEGPSPVPSPPQPSNEPLATVSPTSGSPSAGPALVATLRPEVVSSAVWAGGRAPVILALYGPAGRINTVSGGVTAQLATTDGGLSGPPVEAVAVRPPGVNDVSYVATLDIPTPGWWRILVRAANPAAVLAGSVDVAVLDPGTTAGLGSAAPTARTPTLDDVGGDARAVTTDPAPDLRLSRTSTTDALAAHEPFVLVIDSTRFRVSPACGKAIVMARYLLDRWPAVPFIHLEPYRYSIVTDTPQLDGTLSDPPLTPPAEAWGIGGYPWGATSMPWIFVVDGAGTVRAKYQGIIGSDDVDVILSLIAAGG